MLKYFFQKILIFLLPIFSFGQSYKNIAIAENFTVKEVRSGDEIIDEKYKNNFYYIYSYNDLKNNVLVYTKNSSDNDLNFEFINYTLSQKTINKLLFTINKTNRESRKLEIVFYDKNMSITIDKSVFYLNKAYYYFLKEKLLNKKDMSQLIDLIDDFLQEDIFGLEKLRYFSSKEKYRNEKFRILRAKITTVNAQNENIIINWVINYSYSKEGVLASVKQKFKDELRYSKTLINHKNNTFSYKIYWQVDERFSDDKNVTFDATQIKYSDKGTYLQVGLNKETDSETKIIKSINSSSLKLELNQSELTIIVQKLIK